MSSRNVIIGQVTCHECNQYLQVGVSAEPRAHKIPATKFMAKPKVPTATCTECECVLCTVKLKTTKDRRSLHNVANGEVLRYSVEMVHNTLGTDAAKVFFPSACRVCRPCLRRVFKSSRPQFTTPKT